MQVLTTVIFCEQSTHAFNPANKWICQHLMAVNGKFSDITLSDVREVADRFGVLGECADVIEQVQNAIADWPKHAKNACLHPSEVDRIAEDLARARF